MNFSRLQAVYSSFGMKLLDVKVGQLLEIHEIIGEWDNKRNWKFKCLVLSVKNAQHPTGTFLVRGVSSGIVIEKIYPLCFDKFSKIILLDESKTRRAKLYYLRDKVGKWAKLKSNITSERRNMDLLTLPAEEVTSDTTIDMAILDNKAMADEKPMMQEETTTPMTEEVTMEEVTNEDTTPESTNEETKTTETTDTKEDNKE